MGVSQPWVSLPLQGLLKGSHPLKERRNAPPKG